MFLSLAQSTENEEGNSSAGVQALHLTCVRLPTTDRGSPFTYFCS